MVGGFYQRLMAIVQSSLKKVIGKALLNYNEMVTIVTEIEGLLNSRPLTYLNEENVSDLLTPNYLIYGRDINADQITSYNEIFEINGEEMRRTASTFRNIINHFLKRFMRDNEIFETPLPPPVIENTGNNLRHISKRCFHTQFM